MQERIEQSWETCKGWITEYEGMVTEVQLKDIDTQLLYAAFKDLSTKTSHFRFCSSWGDEIDQEQNSNDSQLKKLTSLLIEAKIADMEVFYTAKFENFDFNVHIIVDITENNRAMLNILWWADEVFPPGTNHKERLYFVMSHLLELQNLFQSKALSI